MRPASGGIVSGLLARKPYTDARVSIRTWRCDLSSGSRRFAGSRSWAGAATSSSRRPERALLVCCVQVSAPCERHSARRPAQYPLAFVYPPSGVCPDRQSRIGHGAMTRCPNLVRCAHSFATRMGTAKRVRQRPALAKDTVCGRTLSDGRFTKNTITPERSPGAVHRITERARSCHGFIRPAGGRPEAASLSVRLLSVAAGSSPTGSAGSFDIRGLPVGPGHWACA